MEHVVVLQMAGRWICGVGVGESRMDGEKNGMEIAKTPWNCLCFKMSSLEALKDPGCHHPDTFWDLKLKEKKMFVFQI